MRVKQSQFIVGVDSGGTFTDVVVMSESGEVWTAKAPTTPDDFSRRKGKKGGDVNPLSGEELEAIAKEIVVQPPEIIERMKKLLGK